MHSRPFQTTHFNPSFFSILYLLIIKTPQPHNTYKSLACFHHSILSPHLTPFLILIFSLFPFSSSNMYSMNILEKSSSKKKLPIWKKALIHSTICFVMGFFSGFAPTTITTNSNKTHQPINNLAVLPESINGLQKSVGQHVLLNQSLIAQLPMHNESNPVPDNPLESDPKGLLIIITTAQSGDSTQPASLMRMAHTLKSVHPPLLWVLVESHSDAPETARLLRDTGVMYRHVTYKENFTDFEEEIHHQRNVALSHLEHHRLTGLVHFADRSNFYDPRFFEEIRQIE